MKNTIAMSNLRLKRETLRTLNNMQLGGVRGGGNAAPLMMDSAAGDTCPALAVVVKPQTGG